jgi:hypothetical protein
MKTEEEIKDVVGEGGFVVGIGEGGGWNTM